MDASEREREKERKREAMMVSLCLVSFPCCLRPPSGVSEMGLVVVAVTEGVYRI
jgi:hypothetical protein